MPRNKTLSHEKIVIAAKKEFLEKGFEKASMREIGKDAGMTQAALYRHYNSKEDMFCSLVSPAIDYLNKLIEEHKEQTYINLNGNISVDELFLNNSTTMAKELFTKYRDELKLLICCSQGTKYENFIHRLVHLEQEGLVEALNYLNDKKIVNVKININELHLLLSAYITAIFEPIAHDWPLEEALHSLDVISNFFIPGWKKIMGF